MIGLDPGQLSSLHNMGITVWELRQNDSSTQQAEPIALLDESLLQYRCIVITAPLTEIEQRLLNAIFFAVNVSPEQTLIIEANQWSQLAPENLAHITVLVFGQQYSTDELSSDTKVLETITTVSLKELLDKPEKKAQLWLDLQAFKARLAP